MQHRGGAALWRYIERKRRQTCSVKQNDIKRNDVKRNNIERINVERNSADQDAVNQKCKIVIKICGHWDSDQDEEGTQGRILIWKCSQTTQGRIGLEWLQFSLLIVIKVVYEWTSKTKFSWALIDTLFASLFIFFYIIF